MAVVFEHPWLIQRLARPNKSGIKPPAFSVGSSGLSKEAEEVIESFFSFEFMGSDEYQTGNVGQALAYMGKNHKKFIPFSIRAPYGKHIYVYCHKDIRKPVTQFLDGLVHGEVYVRDKLYLRESFENGGIVTRAWLDLKNKVFFTADGEMFLNIVKLLREWKFPNNGLDVGLVV